jgi:diguanylate cyclase (GGDEF)-like protein
MILDPVSLLTAIAFSSAALMLTMFMAWLGLRRDDYLLSWSIGLALIIIGVVLFSIAGKHYEPLLMFLSFGFTLVGTSFIHAGAMQFRGLPLPLMKLIALNAAFNLVIATAFITGYSGFGAIIGNLGLALYLALSGENYWRARHEAHLPMAANALLYWVSAFSFVLCAVALATERQWQLTGRPDTWAELVNSVVVIVGLTGIGAISLTLNQSRSASHHERQAMIDPLTGLLNRRALFAKLSAGRLETSMAVIMFDIDHFKSINDQHGHMVGDLVLEQFGTVVHENLRHGDIAARLGGEEFCIVVRKVDQHSASLVANRIRSAFAEAAVPTCHGIAQTTVSAGIAIASRDGETFEDVLARADSALYGAKLAGRNRVNDTTALMVA